MTENFISIVQNAVSFFGIQIKKYPSRDLRRRSQIIRTHHINKIVDVGANIGQYALEARKLGFKGEIISFEPLSNAFIKLKKNSKNDNKWKVVNEALGNEDGKVDINIAKNSVSSSISNMLDQHVNSAPESKYINKEKISISKFDSVIDDFYNEADNLFVKIDTQGFEKEVIEGAKNSLKKIKLMQIEMSIAPLYEGQLLFNGMITYLSSLGFVLISLENGFHDDQSGNLLQVDGIFENTNMPVNI